MLPAQKALNLYLKYLWCTGEIRTPPHCPIDGGVIKKLGADLAGVPWTKLDNIEKYKELIAAGEKIAANKKRESLADWELICWNAINIKDALPHRAEADA